MKTCLNQIKNKNKFIITRSKTNSFRRFRRNYTNGKQINTIQNKSNKIPSVDTKMNSSGFLTYKMMEFILVFLIITFILGVFFIIYQLYKINTSLHQYHVLPQYMYDVTRLLEELISRDKELHMRMKTLENHVIVLTQTLVDSNSLTSHITKTLSSGVVLGSLAIGVYIVAQITLAPLLKASLR
jgi:hypothetical protein